MEENAHLKVQVDKCKDAIKILTSEYNKLSTSKVIGSEIISGLGLNKKKIEIRLFFTFFFFF